MTGTGERSMAQVAAYVAAAVLVAIAGFRYLDRGGDESSPPPVAVAGASSAEAGRSHGEGDRRLYVHVAGQVQRPGLYRMPVGSRVGAVIDRAGGIRQGADLSAVNLAGEVQDGQQVLVPKRGAAPIVATGATGSAGTTTTAGAPAAPISLSQATIEELDAGVDGIGPTLAGAIIEFRDERGSVESIDELAEVDGIGDERLAALREALVP